MAFIPLGALYVNRVKTTKTKIKNKVPISKSISNTPHNIYNFLIF
nr:hypothetical protein [Staphylococcus epidermidis]